MEVKDGRISKILRCALTRYIFIGGEGLPSQVPSLLVWWLIHHSLCKPMKGTPQLVHRTLSRHTSVAIAKPLIIHHSVVLECSHEFRSILLMGISELIDCIISLHQNEVVFSLNVRRNMVSNDMRIY